MENYYVGLDLGTDSIGWAVTDEKYNVLKFKGNAMWGVRLLDSGETALERRTHRSERRRTDRNKFRQQCLEMLFDEAVSNVDISFFQRLKESSFYGGDKSVDGKYSLFNDKNYTDKNYFRDYPTIYHLRQELIQNPEPHDIRLLFLAVSHIIKNRGHFLFDGDDFCENFNSDFEKIFNELNYYIHDNYDVNELRCDDWKIVEDALKNSSLTVTKKKEILIREFNLNKKDNPLEISIVILLSGGTVKAKELFDTEGFNDSEAKSISFKSGYDENEVIYESVFGERFELIERIKAVYDWSVLADILRGEDYISYAKVKTYNKHKSDLALLKEYIKKYLPEEYNLVFNLNDGKTENYLSYSGYSSKSPVKSKCNQEDFCEFLRKLLPKEPKSDEYAQMYEEILSGTFMPKAVTKDNSVIPMQLNRKELIAILQNAEKYFPFLLNKDDNNKTVSEKIIDIFNFRIPYYVGPLNTHSERSWVVRTNEKIYPWNFETVVNIDKSAERFIENLTSKCTYLWKEDVIPKNSLLYSAFSVLNELNNLKIDGEPISCELKQDIYRDLFEKRNKVTLAALKKYFISKGFSNVEITGIDGDFKSTLKPFRDLETIDLPLSDKENIIKAVTIFGDDKKLLKKRLKNIYGNRISEEDIYKISKMKYSGWGRLSKKLLTGIFSDIQYVGQTNIIRALWETNNNLMQLLSKDYDFTKNINDENEILEFTSLKSEVDKLYVSPKIKRPIYQAMQIIEEIVKIKGCGPKKIFIEVARCDGEKNKRTVSRKQKLLDLYKECKNIERDLYEELNSQPEDEFKRDALFLYFTQLGKCMYTGKPISLSDLSNKNIYDIDHIYPRSKIKDDSIDNRVLVLRTANAGKKNIYPVNADIREKMTPFWKKLRTTGKEGLISQKKFDRLTRNTPLTDDELSDFAARQLVETRQSTKAVAQLLKKRYPSTQVEYIKAALVHDFRNKYGFVKSREINDFHHAKDAYLNIVVGNVYTMKVRQEFFVRNIQNGSWSIDKIFNYSTPGAWIAENDESINTVMSVMRKNNIRFTRYAYKKSGKLFDATIEKKTGNGKISLKENSPLSDISKYGGYKKPAAMYFAIVETVEKKKNSVVIVPIYLHNESKYISDPIDYVSKILNKNVSKILVPCVKIDSLFKVNGFNIHLSGNGDKQRFVFKPAIQLILNENFEKYIKVISKYLAWCKTSKKEEAVTSFDNISAEENLMLYNELCEKLTNTVYKAIFKDFANKLLESKKCFTDLSLYEQCCTLDGIINYLHANAVCKDLEYLKVKCPEYRMSKILSSNKNVSFKIVNQSITGLFENEFELLN